MKKQVKTIFSAMCFCLLLSVTLSAVAQSAEYTKINVKGRVQLEVPSNWIISEGKVLEIYGASFLAQSTPEPPKISVMISINSISPPVGQADLQQKVLASKQQALKSFAEGEITLETGGGSKNVGYIGEHLALITHNDSPLPKQPETTMRVTKYTVPLGAEGITIMFVQLIHAEDDPQATEDYNRLKSSIVIQ